MLTELAKGVVEGVAGLVGVKEAEGPAPGEASATREPADPSVADAVAAEVKTVLEAAQESASRIVADAREEAERILSEARREAAAIRARASSEATPEAPAPQSGPEPVAKEQPSEEPGAVEESGSVDEPEPVEESGPVEEPEAGDEGAARLMAMNLALGGSGKEEIAAAIEAELGSVPGLDGLIDEVLARAKG